VTDVETIRQAIHSKQYPDALAALDRLVAERDKTHEYLQAETTRADGYAQRLRVAEAERDEARDNERHMRNLHDWRAKGETEQRARAEAAEAERDEALDRWRNQSDLADKWAARAEAAEAERDEALAANEAAKQFSYASHRQRAEAAEAERDEARRNEKAMRERYDAKYINWKGNEAEVQRLRELIADFKDHIEDIGRPGHLARQGALLDRIFALFKEQI
jgi:hypothetical protein